MFDSGSPLQALASRAQRGDPQSRGAAFRRELEAIVWAPSFAARFAPAKEIRTY